MPDHPLPSSVGYIDGLYVDSVKIFKTIATTLELTQSQIAEGATSLLESRSKVPLDIPDPSFKGPF